MRLNVCLSAADWWGAGVAADWWEERRWLHLHSPCTYRQSCSVRVEEIQQEAYKHPWGLSPLPAPSVQLLPSLFPRTLGLFVDLVNVRDHLCSPLRLTLCDDWGKRQALGHKASQPQMCLGDSSQCRLRSPPIISPLGSEKAAAAARIPAGGNDTAAFCYPDGCSGFYFIISQSC